MPPTITEAPQSKTINEGDRLQLTCKASGQPTPTITWTKDGNQLGKTVDIQNSKRTDAGTYVCKAENKVTQVTASAQVTVQCKSERFVPLWLAIHVKKFYSGSLLRTSFVVWLCVDALHCLYFT